MRENNQETYQDFKPAGILYRFVGAFAVAYEFIIFFAVLEIIPFLSNASKQTLIIVALIAYLLFLIYVIIMQSIAGHTIAQKRAHLIIVKTNKKVPQKIDLIKRMIIKAVLFLSWLALNAGIIILLSIGHWADIKFAIFSMVVIIAPAGVLLLMKPLLNNKTQTLYDYLSNTLVLVDYEAEKKEEREQIELLVENPSLIFQRDNKVPLRAAIAASVTVLAIKMYRMFKKANRKDD